VEPRRRLLYAAAMAAFAALALAPLLVIALHVAETFGDEKAVLHGLALVIDRSSARRRPRAQRRDLRPSPSPHGAALATVLSIVIALFAGSRLFLRAAARAHAMWNTPVQHRNGLMRTFVAFLAAGALSVCVIGGMTLIVFGSAAFEAAVHARRRARHRATIGIHLGVGAMGALILAPDRRGALQMAPRHASGLGPTSGSAPSRPRSASPSPSPRSGVYLATENLPWTTAAPHPSSSCCSGSTTRRICFS